MQFIQIFQSSNRYFEAELNVTTTETQTKYIRSSCSTCVAVRVQGKPLTLRSRGSLYIPVNGRSRLRELSLPQGYIGNVLFRGLCIANSGDVACKPLRCTVSKVQEALVRMDNEYFRSAIDYLALNPGLTCLNPSLTWIEQERCPTLSINSWIGLLLSKADFGSGGQSYLRLGGVGYEGQTLIMPSTNGDGSLTVSINLSSAHMKQLKNSIYDFVEIHASL